MSNDIEVHQWSPNTIYKAPMAAVYDSQEGHVLIKMHVPGFTTFAHEIRDKDTLIGLKEQIDRAICVKTAIGLLLDAKKTRIEEPSLGDTPASESPQDN